MKDSKNSFTKSENDFLKSNGTPELAQRLLDSMPYRNESKYVPAICALRDWKAHCFDGSLLAAAALRRRGYKPYIIDLCAVRDDDHLLCAYQWRGHWGAVAKSNFPGLRFREPIYKTPRELAMSYFELYFNLKGEKSLREFSKPFALPAIKKLDWETDSSKLGLFLEMLEKTPHYPLLTNAQIKVLAPIDKRLMRSQMTGVSLRGAHGGSSYQKPKTNKLKRPSL